MADATTKSVIILNRTTYDAKKQAGEILSNTIYIVQEISLNSETFLSMYLGLNRQTDLIDLDEYVNPQNQEIDLNLLQLPNVFPTTGKIYTVTDTINDVVRAYSALDDGTLVPLYGTPVWEE